jgi:FAD/FMN-containing dehydrogenase
LSDSQTSSWGNLYPGKQKLSSVLWRNEEIPSGAPTLLAIGNRRSYGDVCVNEGGLAIDMMRLNRFISFDRENGILRCEAGVTFREIATVTIPAGWFLPVTPGTSFVSLGGAVANDVHGKNHHVSGSFGCFVRSFELRRSSGEALVCSPTENEGLFAATIGGCGLTGTIVWVEISLKRIVNTTLGVESLSYSGYEEFLRLSAESEQSHEYCVSWIDCLATGDRVGSGVFFRANHQTEAVEAGVGSLHPESWMIGKTRSVPAIFGKGFPLINQLSLRMFNALYTRTHAGNKNYIESFQKYFYPLDSLRNWNRIYGRRGFFQFQCVVPYANQQAIADILGQISASGQGSFLSVLKTMGETKSPGMMSFCRPGVTLALDFPNGGKKTRRLLSDLESIVVEADGAIYPAKDAVMSADTFRQCYPALEEFKQYVDDAYSSGFWRRVNSDA